MPLMTQLRPFSLASYNASDETKYLSIFSLNFSHTSFSEKIANLSLSSVIAVLLSTSTFFVPIRQENPPKKFPS